MSCPSFSLCVWAQCVCVHKRSGGGHNVFEVAHYRANLFMYFLAVIRISKTAENRYSPWVAIVMPSCQSELLPNLQEKTQKHSREEKEGNSAEA